MAVAPPPSRLFLAVWSGALEDVAAQLERTAPTELAALLDAPGPGGETPLHLALRAGHVEIAKLLIDSGASLSSRDSESRQALYAALQLAGGEGAFALRAFEANAAQLEASVQRRLPSLFERLAAVPDFQATVNFQFQTWVPLLGRLLPGDSCRVAKAGCSIRLDCSLAGMRGLSWRRGDLSFIFVGPEAAGAAAAATATPHAGRLLVLDHIGRRFAELNPRALGIDDEAGGASDDGEQQKPPEEGAADGGVRDALDLQLTSSWPEMDWNSRAVEITPEAQPRGWLGGLFGGGGRGAAGGDAGVVERVGAFSARLYRMHNLKVRVDLWPPLQPEREAEVAARLTAAADLAAASGRPEGGAAVAQLRDRPAGTASAPGEQLPDAAAASTAAPHPHSTVAEKLAAASAAAAAAAEGDEAVEGGPGSGGGVAAALALLQQVVLADAEAPAEGGKEDGDDDDEGAGGSEGRELDVDLDIDTDPAAGGASASGGPPSAAVTWATAGASAAESAPTATWAAVSEASGTRLRRSLTVPCGRRDVLSVPLVAGQSAEWRVTTAALALTVSVAWHPDALEGGAAAAPPLAAGGGVAGAQPATLWGPALCRAAEGRVSASVAGCVTLSLDNRASAFTARRVDVELCRSGVSSPEGPPGDDIALASSPDCWAVHEGAPAPPLGPPAAGRSRRPRALASHPLAAVLTSASGIRRVTFAEYFGVPLREAAAAHGLGDGSAAPDASAPPLLGASHAGAAAALALSGARAAAPPFVVPASAVLSTPPAPRSFSRTIDARVWLAATARDDDPSPAAASATSPAASPLPTPATTFPLTVEQLLPVVEVLSRTTRHFENVLRFLRSKFPPGFFPVKFTVPVVPAISALVEFTSVDLLSPIAAAAVASHMVVPPGYADATADVYANQFFERCGVVGGSSAEAPGADLAALGDAEGEGKAEEGRFAGKVDDAELDIDRDG